MRFTPPVVDRRRPLRALSCALLLAAFAALFAIPSLARAAEPSNAPLPLINTTEEVGPGITLHHLKSLGESGWQDEQVLTVHLNEAGVSTNILTSGPVASGGPLTEAANKAGAVAGVNGGFFDIGNSNAAEGGEIGSGELIKSPDVGISNTNHFGVSKAGLAELANLATQATAEFGGASQPVLSVNAADGGHGVPANGMVAYTPAWGTYSRARGFTGVTNLAEVLVVNNKVVSVDSTGAQANQIPAGGFVLVGRESAAEAIRALKPGEEVKLTYGLSAEATQELQFAIGDGGTIIENGTPVGGLDSSIAPRTAAGFKDGGHTLVLATWDGPGGTGNGGIGVNVEAAEMVEEGVETAVNLDGGGSTTMVARALGAEGATVRNTPSDGTERSDPNGIGVFVEPGDGAVHHMFVNPGPHVLVVAHPRQAHRAGRRHGAANFLVEVMGELAGAGLGEMHAVARAQAPRLPFKVRAVIVVVAGVVDEPVPDIHVSGAGFLGAPAIEIVEIDHLGRGARTADRGQPDPEYRNALALEHAEHFVDAP